MIKFAVLLILALSFSAMAQGQTRHLINKRTTTTYTVNYNDRAVLVTQSNANPSTYTLPVFANGWYAWFQNRGAGTLTITPTAATIDGASTLVFTTGQGAFIVSDGFNYFSERGVGSGGGGGGGATIPSVTNLISGNGSGNGADSGIAPSAVELKASKDATNGYVGMTLYKLNFKDGGNSFTSFLSNSNTAARTYTFQNRDGTIADDTDLALKAPLATPTFTGPVTVSGSGAGEIDLPEGAAPAGIVSNEVVWADSTSHHLMGKLNNGPAITFAGTTDIPYDLFLSFDGVPTASSTFRMVTPRNVAFGASWAGTVCSAGTAATAQTDFLIQKNGSTVGTLRFAAAGTTCSIVSPTTTTMTAADVLTVVAPASPDTTLANIAITLKGNLP